MEGPSLYLAVRQLAPFRKQVIESVGGNTRIEKERFAGKQVRDIFSWGKHLVFQFDEFALKVHFLLYGTYEAEVEGASVTGDYRKARVPRLSFGFPNGKIDMFNCSVKIIEDARFKKTYDYSIDIMSRKWDPEQAVRNMKARAEAEIADVLLDQEVFGGVGNIIKNEVLSLARVHPQTKAGKLTAGQKKEIVELARSFSFQFYRWRKKFVLKKNLKIHRKGFCPHCGAKPVNRKTGKRNRWSHWCEACQPLKA